MYRLTYFPSVFSRRPKYMMAVFAVVAATLIAPVALAQAVSGAVAFGARHQYGGR